MSRRLPAEATLTQPPVGPVPDAPRDSVPSVLAGKIQELASKAKHSAARRRATLVR